MVVEIRPIKIPLSYKGQTIKTTKWMNFHIWQVSLIILFEKNVKY